jgi:hypothetical protein
MDIGIKVDVDLNKMLRGLESAQAGDAMELLTRTVEADMRPYVKRDTGQTVDSAQILSDFRAGEIVYDATRVAGHPYAEYAYEDPHVAKTDTNPKATAHWKDAAERDRAGEWGDLLRDELARQMR